MDNLITIPTFASVKQVPVKRIYALIESGVLEPVDIDGKKFINKDKYQDFDAKATHAPVRKADRLEKTVTQLQRKVTMLENIVFAVNEEGRGKAKKAR